MLLHALADGLRENALETDIEADWMHGKQLGRRCQALRSSVYTLTRKERRIRASTNAMMDTTTNATDRSNTSKFNMLRATAAGAAQPCQCRHRQGQLRARVTRRLAW